MNVDQLFEAVESQAQALNYLVLEKALALIDALPDHCTYARYQSAYIQALLDEAKRQRMYDRRYNGTIRFDGTYSLNARERQGRIDTLRRQRYYNPCHVCVVCCTRTKPWPKACNDEWVRKFVGAPSAIREGYRATDVMKQLLPVERKLFMDR